MACLYHIAIRISGAADKHSVQHTHARFPSDGNAKYACWFNGLAIGGRDWAVVRTEDDRDFVVAIRNTLSGINSNR